MIDGELFLELAGVFLIILFCLACATCVGACGAGVYKLWELVL